MNKNNLKTRRISRFWIRRIVKTAPPTSTTSKLKHLPALHHFTTKPIQLTKLGTTSRGLKKRKYFSNKLNLLRVRRGQKPLFRKVARSIKSWRIPRPLSVFGRNPLVTCSGRPTANYLKATVSNLDSFSELGLVHNFLQEVNYANTYKALHTIHSKVNKTTYIGNLSMLEVVKNSPIGFSWKTNIINTNVNLHSTNLTYHHLISHINTISLDTFLSTKTPTDVFNAALLSTRILSNRVTVSNFVSHPTYLTIEPNKFPVLENFYNYNSLKINSKHLNTRDAVTTNLRRPVLGTTRIRHTRLTQNPSSYYKQLVKSTQKLLSPENFTLVGGKKILYAVRVGRIAHFTKTRYLLFLVGRYFSRQMNASLSKNKLIGNNRFKLFAFHFSFKKYLSSLVHRGYFVDNQFDWFDSAWTQANFYSRVEAYTNYVFDADNWSASLFENSMLMNKDFYASPLRLVDPGSNYFTSAQSGPKKLYLTSRKNSHNLKLGADDLTFRVVVAELLTRLKFYMKKFSKTRRFKRVRRFKWSTLGSTITSRPNRKRRLFFKALKRFMQAKLRNTVHLNSLVVNTRILQLFLNWQCKKNQRKLLRRFKFLTNKATRQTLKFQPRRRYKMRKKLQKLRSSKRFRVKGAAVGGALRTFMGGRVVTLLNRNSLVASRFDALSPLTSCYQVAPVRSGTVNDLLGEKLLTNIFFYNETLSNPLLFKHALVNNRLVNNTTTLSSTKITSAFTQTILRDYSKFFFGRRSNQMFKSNIVGLNAYPSIIKRRLIKVFRSRKFDTKVMLWNYNLLGRFMEHCTGHKVYLKLNPWVDKSLRNYDQALARVWYSRVAIFQRMLGPRIFLHESIKIILIALKYKDPMFLCNWIRAMLYRMSFYKYRLLFRYLKYVVGSLLEPSFGDLGLRGFKLRLKGKICVAGNARTRKLLFKVGSTGHSKKSNKVIHHSTLINSFTGVMGFNLWIYF